MDPNATPQQAAQAATLQQWNEMFSYYVAWRNRGGFRASNAALDAAEDRRSELTAV